MSASAAGRRAAQYQYTLEDADLAELDDVGTEGHRGAAQAPGAQGRQLRSADPGPPARSRDRSRHRGAARHHGRDDRQHAVRRVRPAPGRGVLHADQPVPRRARGDAAIGTGPDALDRIYVPSATGAQVPLSDARQGDALGGRALDRPPGPVPGDHDLVQPRARRRARRCGRTQVDAATAKIGMPASIHGQFAGTAQAFEDVKVEREVARAARAASSSTSCSAFCTRATSTRSRSCRRCRRPGSARCSRCSSPAPTLNLIGDDRRDPARSASSRRTRS